MKAQKIAIAAGTGIAFLLCLAGLWVAYGAYDKASKVKATLDGTKRDLEKIYNESPFPNATNVAVLRGDAIWMTNWFQSLVADLHAAAVPAESLSPSGFIQKLQDTSTELHRKAASEGGKVLAEGFGFGFDRYFRRGNPAPEHVKRLALQFSMVEAVTREILDSHVSALSQVDREEFEGGGAEAPAASGRPLRRGPQAPVSTVAVVATTADNRYPRQHFTFTFTADERALSEVLARLAKIKLFVVVTEVKTERVDRGLRPMPEKQAVEADKAKAATLPAEQRVVAGPEVAPLLKTQLQIDVYTFEGV